MIPTPWSLRGSLWRYGPRSFFNTFAVPVKKPREDTASRVVNRSGILLAAWSSAAGRAAILARPEQNSRATRGSGCYNSTMWSFEFLSV